jgi:hypothetical protein
MWIDKQLQYRIYKSAKQLRNTPHGRKYGKVLCGSPVFVMSGVPGGHVVLGNEIVGVL